LAGDEPDLLVTVGAGGATRRWGPDAGGTLHDFGVDAGFGGPTPGLPLSLTIAAYLLRAGEIGCAAHQELAPDAPADACSRIGADLAGLAERVSLLVMADGSARRTRQSPGPSDERAAAFDAEVWRSLGSPDPAALLAIDPDLAGELWVAGRPGWQVLAGALLASTGNWSGELIHTSAPLGVGYVVARLHT